MTNNLRSSGFWHRLTNKAICRAATVCIYVGLALASSSAVAQSYNINWVQISSGGGELKGNTFSVDGTAGQGVATAPLNGSTYSVSSGFWSYTPFPTPPPILVILSTSSNTVMISWSSSLSGIQLEVTTSLTALSWAAAPETVNGDGTNKFIFVSVASSQSRFYRLVKP